MAASGTQTVFGFGTGLDWRPTVFVNPFPSTSVCSACGFVPSTVATLLCRHLLCQPCYDRSARKHGRCPLDMEPVHDGNVVWSSTSKDSILRRKVRCWNAHNGCEAEAAASAMLEHYANACEFHTVSCPRCGEKMRHRDITKHLEPGGPPSSSREQPLGDKLVNAVLNIKEVLGNMSEQTAHLRTTLDLFEEHLDKGSSTAAQPRMVADAMTAIVDKTSWACQTGTETALADHGREVTSHFKEAMTMKKVLGKECEREVQAFNLIVAEEPSPEREVVNSIFAFLEQKAKCWLEKGDKKPMELLAALSLCMESDVLSVSMPYWWQVSGWTRFCKQRDEPVFLSPTQGKARYHFGYLIIPQLWYSPLRDCVWFRVHVVKGLFDNFLEWPMNKKLRVSFYHFFQRQYFDCTVDLERAPQADTLPNVAKKVMSTSCSQPISLASLGSGYYGSENTLRILFQFVS